MQDVSTGDLAPDGVEVMAYRSNVPAIAEFTFRHCDPEFGERIREWGGGFIVTTTGRAPRASTPRSPRCSSACAR